MGVVAPISHAIREGIHLSFSQVSTFLRCPRLYAFKYVRGERSEFTPFALPFGKAVHRAAETMYRHIKDEGTKPDSLDVTAAFRSAFNEELEGSEAVAPVRLKDGDSIPEAEKLGIALVGILHERTQPVKVLGVEHPFSVALPGRPERFVGIFDLIEQDEEGTVVLVELKTAARRWSDSQLDWDLQSSGYGHALKATGIVDGLDPVVVRHDVLIKNHKKPDMERYATLKTESQRMLAIRTAAEVAATIESSVGPVGHVRGLPSPHGS